MSSNEMPIEEARKQLGDLAIAAMHGQTTVLTRYGKPVAMLVPYAPQESAVTTYTATVGPDNADWLTSQYHMTALGLPVAKGLGDGRVEISADTVEAMRELPEHYDAHVDANDYIWIAGDGYKLTADAITSAEQWANALDAEMRRTGQDAGTLISFGYANGQILGVPLDPEHPDAVDERGVIASDSGWVVGYDAQSGYWTAR